MRRSGRTNAGSVPAFFTRSRAKNFFNTCSTVTRSRDSIKQQKQEESKAEPEKNPEAVVKSKGKSPEIIKDKVEPGDQAQQQQNDQSKFANDTKTPCEVSGDGQSSAQDAQPEGVDHEMKVEEPELKVPVVKTENVSPRSKQNENVSATTKALKQMEQMMDSKKNFKKKPKLPSCIRRRKLNQRLNKILTPKSGLIFLHELKPGCTFKIQEQPNSNPPIFVAQVEYNEKILAVGQGMTKPSAKNAAAENAIKVLVAEALTQRTVERDNTKSDMMEKCNSIMEEELMDTSEDLSLAGLASFAMYKMFTEWQSQGTDLPLLSFQQKKKPTVSKVSVTKKELPPNADKLHPSFLLNTMRPGVIATELERSSKDNVSFVTMAYEIDGKMYTGSGSNKKEARKMAAKAALSDLYGLKYED